MNAVNHPDERQSGRNLLVLWIGTFTAAICFSLVVPFLPRFISSLGVVENLFPSTDTLSSLVAQASSDRAFSLSTPLRVCRFTGG